MSEPNCRHCRSWSVCHWGASEISAMWFAYGDISWCSRQTFWLLKYAEILHRGEWPVPDATVAGGMRGKKVTEAAYTKVIEIITEVDERLIRTGWRGRLLAEECINRDRLEYLSQDARDALYYVSGWPRKEMRFKDWRKKRRYRVHQKVPTEAI